MDNHLTLAKELASLSAEVIKKHFRTPLTIDPKADNSPVTLADREAEAVMRELIRKTYPTHGIIGEEYGTEQENAEFCWILDPIDGTKNFMSGQPIFGTLIGLLYQNKPILGIINQPILGECWIGQSGEKTTFNGKPVSTRSNATLGNAILSTTSPYLFTEKQKQAFDKLVAATPYQTYGSDCYAYAMLASGYLDIVAEAQMKPHDALPLIPIIEGAGGVVTDWEGRPIMMKEEIELLACGNNEICSEAFHAMNT